MNFSLRIYKSAMNMERIEEHGFEPIRCELHRVEETASREDLARCIAELRTAGVHAIFTSYSMADKKNSSVYAFYLDRGGLFLPDREYYLADSFGGVRDAYLDHVARMFALAGDRDDESKRLAELVLSLETDLAKTSRARADLRDEEKNYNRIAVSDLESKFPSMHLPAYFEAFGVAQAEYVVMGQPEFFESLDRLLSEGPIEPFRTYLRWRVLHAYAPYLHSPVEAEDLSSSTGNCSASRNPRFAGSSQHVRLTV
ncbi:MAG: hypothetical protein ACRECH_05670 [Nitrososphaerales archaeon]